MEAGFDPDAFWRQTPRLYGIVLRARGEAAETEHKYRAWLAHTTASLMGFAHHAPKKMPKLETLTGERPAPRVQTPEEMQAVFAAIRAELEA